MKSNSEPGPPTSLTPDTVEAVADTGATGTYIGIQLVKNAHHMKPTNNPIRVKLPNSSTIISTHSMGMKIGPLPPAITQAEIFEELHNTGLLGLGPLCDAGCKAVFKKHDFELWYKGEVILRGTRCNKTGLWITHITTHLLLNSRLTQFPHLLLLLYKPTPSSPFPLLQKWSNFPMQPSSLLSSPHSSKPY